jgi:hypothetical protein
VDESSVQNFVRRLKFFVNKVLLKIESFRLKVLVVVFITMMLMRFLFRNRQGVRDLNSLVWSYAGPKTIY